MNLKKKCGISGDGKICWKQTGYKNEDLYYRQKGQKNNPNLLPSVLLIAKFKNVGSVWGYLYINHIFLDLQIDFSPLSELYC